MAPAKDEDFVLTLSDDENPIEDEEADEVAEADTASKKSKREEGGFKNTLLYMKKEKGKKGGRHDSRQEKEKGK